MSRIYCLSTEEFEEVMRSNSWIDEKDLPETVAIISIIGTELKTDKKTSEEVPKEEHWFPDSKNKRILRLNFDNLHSDKDITDEYGWKVIKKAFSVYHARASVDFILNNLGKDIYISCFDKERSLPYVQFISEFFSDFYGEKLTKEERKQLNIEVLYLLRSAMREYEGEFFLQNKYIKESSENIYYKRLRQGKYKKKTQKETLSSLLPTLNKSKTAKKKSTKKTKPKTKSPFKYNWKNTDPFYVWKSLEEGNDNLDY